MIPDQKMRGIMVMETWQKVPTREKRTQTGRYYSTDCQRKYRRR